MTKGNKSKPAPKPVKGKRSISGPPEMFQAADYLMEQRMIPSFSEYVRALIRADIEDTESKKAV